MHGPDLAGITVEGPRGSGALGAQAAAVVADLRLGAAQLHSSHLLQVLDRTEPLPIVAVADHHGPVYFFTDLDYDLEAGNANCCWGCSKTKNKISEGSCELLRVRPRCS